MEDPGVEGRIILIWIFKMDWHGLDWFGSELGQVRAVVNAVINLQVP
jgi:hypothetical protein